MTPSFDRVQQLLKRLPGLGHRSAERVALHLLVERPQDLPSLLAALQEASETIQRCTECGNLAEEPLCPICQNPQRDAHLLCIVEHVPDLMAIERSSAYRGRYHVLYGKLSPLHQVGPENLNLHHLAERIQRDQVEEVVLALGNDVEGEATCHYLQEEILDPAGVKVTRIGFGLPSGGGVTMADASTLRSALESRRRYE
ncbi:MAG: recombination mediator RecR [Verrucomicrobiota bacterium JB022]|nr:recombination mediator RecR [Verrucomicrobiota bacterium JB022]